MEFITIKPGRSPIYQLNRQGLQKCTRVDAAIAYVSDESTLIDGCIRANIPLKLWARYDYSAPVSVPVLKKFVSQRFPNISMRLVADIFHPKVIWWRKFGAYIGSANLTRKAWSDNFEAGVFVTEGELYAEGGMAADLEDFFQEIDDKSHALKREIVEQFEALSRKFGKDKDRLIEEFEKGRQISKPEGMHTLRPDRQNRLREAFLKEWNETLEIMRRIGDRVSADDARPEWVRPETPKGVQADQFLHAYYYHYIAEDRTYPFERHFHENKDRKEEALTKAIQWWRSLDQAPSREDVTMNEWAPFIRDALAPERIRSLNADEFFGVCLRIHALQTHARQLDWARHGRIVAPHQAREERVRLLSDWLLTQTNQHKQGVLELFEYILYEGGPEKVPERIFEAASDEARKIQHLSISSLGEMVGWALPDQFPPRNGRTSKALTALGHDVAIHSR